MHSVAAIVLAAGIASSAPDKTIRIDATVSETQQNCFVCRIAVVGAPAGVTLAVRELHVEKGGAATIAWSEHPTRGSRIEYNATCSIFADASKAKVVLKIRARDRRRAYEGTHVAVVKPTP